MFSNHDHTNYYHPDAVYTVSANTERGLSSKYEFQATYLDTKESNST